MTALRRFAEWTWYDEQVASAVVRAALTPPAWLFGRIVQARNERFDGQAAVAAPIPAVSVGNLTVGGTGKTPISSWFAARLRARGANPTLVLRGYGDDEWRVHELLTPDVPVRVSPDRLAALQAARSAGHDCAVLDDAFQHRRAPRVADVVLVSADRWNGRVDLLPAGPYREPFRNLSRATAVIVTVKAADAARVEAVCARISGIPTRDGGTHTPAVVRLMPDALHDARAAAGAAPRPLSTLAGTRVVALSAIADPAAFAQQLRDCGAQVVHDLRFPDHHGFSATDVTGVSRVLHGADLVVCTLKDAVKLAALWPREATPLWYVSQTVVVDRGAEVLERECDRVLAAR
ncbi:MAG: tetraacyldisaccharide 4'-kinase [Gemmatimonadaceae bacterium]|nr:tetraacyldisaccharide 4'-kinase [Gemmatimonadaceae bacterium]